MTRFQFVADHSQRYGVKRLCRVLGVARSSFYHWKATAPARAARQAVDAALAVRIRAVYTAFDGTYGVPRITAELRDPDSRHGGKPVNHKRVARIMRGIGLAGLRLRSRRRTTIPDPAAAKAPDLIGRDFTAAAPNRRYVGDLKCRRRHLMSYADRRTMPKSRAEEDPPLPADHHRRSRLCATRR